MSADQVTGLAGGVTGGGLGGVTGALQGGLGNLLNLGTSYIDRFFPPEKREALKEKLVKFATEKPHLAAFLLSQLALSGLPLALFFIMTITVVIFALIAGILVGVIGAALFIVFAVGVALIILLPTLFFTTFAAVAVWLWGLGAYYILKKFNKKEIPGIHVPMKDGIQEQTGLGDLPGLNGELPLAAPKQKQEAPKSEKPAKAEKGSSSTATSTGHDTNGKENQHPRKSSKPPKLSPERHARTAASGVGDTVGGVTKGLGL